MRVEAEHFMSKIEQLEIKAAVRHVDCSILFPSSQIITPWFCNRYRGFMFGVLKNSVP